MAEGKNTPILGRRNGNLNFSIFKQEKDGKNYYSVCFQRSYKKEGQEEWIRETVNMFPQDLLRLGLLAQGAYNELIAWLQAHKSTPADHSAQQMQDGDIPF